MDRAIILLKITAELLRKQKDSDFVLNLLDQLVVYDGVECDGHSLMEDIEIYLEQSNG